MLQEFHENVCHIAERHMNALEHFATHHFGFDLNYLYTSYVLLRTIKGVPKHQVLQVLGNCPKFQMTKHSLFPKLWQQSDGGTIRKTRSVNLELTVSQIKLWGTHLVTRPRKVR